MAHKTPKLLILHGENIVASRGARYAALQALQTQGFVLESIVGDKVLATELELKLTTPNLFASEALVIDNLLSRLKSAEKTKCLDVLFQNHTKKPVILWEKRELTATMLKPFANFAEIKLFKAAKSLFPFLDSLVPANASKTLKLFRLALKDNDVMLVFSLLVRRVTDLLIAVSDPRELKGSPWATRQLITQSKSWSEPRLRKLYAQMLEIDLATKTGSTKLDLTTQLDLLLLEL